MTKYGVAVLTACLLTASACGDSHTGDGDAGIAVMDSGSTPAPDGAAPDTGGGPIDSGGGPVDSGGGPTDAGPRPDGGGAGIDCMGSTCDPATQECCITGMPGGGGVTGMCIDIGATCMGASIDCDGPEDCAGGEVCCARGGLGGITIGCEPASDMCGAGGFGEFELCNDVADCTAPGDMCCPIDRPGFSASYCAAMCFGTGGP